MALIDPINFDGYNDIEIELADCPVCGVESDTAAWERLRGVWMCRPCYHDQPDVIASIQADMASDDAAEKPF